MLCAFGESDGLERQKTGDIKLHCGPISVTLVDVMDFRFTLLLLRTSHGIVW